MELILTSEEVIHTVFPLTIVSTVAGALVMVADGSNCMVIFDVSKGKGKGIPLQTWSGPEGSRRLRPPYFKTFGTRRG
jgi:hypothetical protein